MGSTHPVLSRDPSHSHSPVGVAVPQTLYWSKTESNKWSLDLHTTQVAPPSPPVGCFSRVF